MKLSDEMLKDEKIQMLVKLYVSVEKLTDYTRKEHYNHDEINNARVHYVPVPPPADMMNMTTKIVERGVNPFRFLPFIKFTETMLQRYTQRESGPSLEPLDRDVIRDCVRVGKAELDMFNDDMNLEINPNYKPVDPPRGFLDHNDALFIRYPQKQAKPTAPQKWIVRDESDQHPRPPPTLNLGAPTDPAAQTSPRTRRLRHKETKKTNHGGFVSNLLFRVLF